MSMMGVQGQDSDAQWVRGLGIDVTASPPAAEQNAAATPRGVDLQLADA